MHYQESLPELLFLAVSVLAAGTFWWNYFRNGLWLGFGVRAESSRYMWLLACAAALPSMCAAVMAIALLSIIEMDSLLALVFFVAGLLQGQWAASKWIFSCAKLEAGQHQ